MKRNLWIIGMILATALVGCGSKEAVSDEVVSVAVEEQETISNDMEIMVDKAEETETEVEESSEIAFDGKTAWYMKDNYRTTWSSSEIQNAAGEKIFSNDSIEAIIPCIEGRTLVKTSTSDIGYYYKSATDIQEDGSGACVSLNVVPYDAADFKSITNRMADFKHEVGQYVLLYFDDWGNKELRRTWDGSEDLYIFDTKTSSLMTVNISINCPDESDEDSHIECKNEIIRSFVETF